MTLYETIGVPRGASKAEIKQAYRRRAKAAHPDAGGNPADFEKLSQAKLVLLDDAKRSKYDQTGTVDDGPDNDMAEVLQIMNQMVQMVVERLTQQRRNPERFDIPKMAIEDIANNVANLKAQIAQQEAKAKKERAFAARFKVKAGKPNYLAKGYEDRAREAEAGVAKMRHVVGQLKRASAMLKDYSFEISNTDEAQMPMMMEVRFG